MNYNKKGIPNLTKHTLQETAEFFGNSLTGVFNIEQRAIAKIKAGLHKYGIHSSEMVFGKERRNQNVVAEGCDED